MTGNYWQGEIFRINSCCQVQWILKPGQELNTLILIFLQVTLWKESVDGQWACISDVNKGQGAVSAITEGQQNEQ